MNFHTKIAAGLALALIGTASSGQTLVCSGVLPDWKVVKTADQAVYTFLKNETVFDVPYIVTALGKTTPIAYTFVANFDTAILLVNAPNGEGNAPMIAHLMTQSQEEAILLTGTCETTPE